MTIESLSIEEFPSAEYDPAITHSAYFFQPSFANTVNNSLPHGKTSVRMQHHSKTYRITYKNGDTAYIDIKPDVVKYGPKLDRLKQCKVTFDDDHNNDDRNDDEVLEVKTNFGTLYHHFKHTPSWYTIHTVEMLDNRGSETNDPGAFLDGSRLCRIELAGKGVYFCLIMEDEAIKRVLYGPRLRHLSVCELISVSCWRNGVMIAETNHGTFRSSGYQCEEGEKGEWLIYHDIEEVESPNLSFESLLQ